MLPRVYWLDEWTGRKLKAYFMISDEVDDTVLARTSHESGVKLSNNNLDTLRT